jgi:hypothetical protein
MDHSIVTRFGGRQWRYNLFKGAISRCFDPIGGEPVEFALPIQYEAWVAQRFDPQTFSITNRPVTVAASFNGRRIAAQATFVVTTMEGFERFFLVAKDAAPEAQLRKLRQVAAVRKATVTVHLMHEVRARVDVFWRMERLRQLATMYSHAGAEFDSQIQSAVGEGACTRSRLLACLSHIDEQLLDSRIAHLHCSHVLHCDFAEDNFGIALAAGSLQ